MSYHPKKRFGQNFLQDVIYIDSIVSILDPKTGENWVEIGPGLGALTIPVLSLIKRLQVIEIDYTLIPELKRRCQGIGELIVHEADALSFDFSSLVQHNQKLHIFGNLPYNISSQLIFFLLKQIPMIDCLYFMLQKEVVDRLVAPVGTAEYGRLGIMVQCDFMVEPLLFVPKEAFYPIPKVDSVFVKLTPRSARSSCDRDQLSELIAKAFMHRRKTIRNALREEISEEQLKQAGIDPQLRPQQITLEQYEKLLKQFLPKRFTR